MGSVAILCKRGCHGVEGWAEDSETKENWTLVVKYGGKLGGVEDCSH